MTNKKLRDQISGTLRNVSNILEASAKKDKKEEETSDDFMSAPALKYLAKNFLKVDLKMDKDTGNYLPSREVLMNRERSHQKALVDVLGKELWGDQYASEPDNSKAFYTTYRNNKDKDVWEAQMSAFAILVSKKLGLTVKGRETFYDQKAIKDMGNAYDAWIKILAEKGSRAAKKALGTEE